MAIDIILDLNVKPEHRDELIDTLAAILPDTRAFPGCNSVAVTVNEDDQCNIVLFEKWETRSDHEKYMAWRTERGDLDKLGALLAGPPSVRYLAGLQGK